MEPPCGVELDPACELFRKGDPSYRSMSPLGRIWLACGGSIMGGAMPILNNLGASRPPFAGVQRIVAFAAIGALIGEVLHRYKDRGQAEKDLHYYHYMTLHPEDFRPPKRILYRDYLEPWTPVR